MSGSSVGGSREQVYLHGAGTTELHAPTAERADVVEGVEGVEGVDGLVDAPQRAVVQRYSDSRRRYN
jgi:hypothetical protein